MKDETTFWQGEAEARISGTEARLNVLNGDLRQIHTTMSDLKTDVGKLGDRVDTVRESVAQLVRKGDDDQKVQISALQKAIDESRVKTRNLIFLLVVPLVAALISGLIPLLILGSSGASH